jgi:hypothetical protein
VAGVDTPVVAYAPAPNQTSEYLAGTVTVSVVFVESNGGSGNCSPADAQTENWSAARMDSVIAEITQGLGFWTSRPNRPSLTFVIENRGQRSTSCEPINRPSSDDPLWIADALVALGGSGITPANYVAAARAYAHSRRVANGTDWAYSIFVVDSDVDGNGLFGDGTFAYAFLNGPFMVMTYDNNGWGIGLTNIVVAHESAHIFGALDEYPESNCTTADSWGYLNAPNTSCNVNGDTSDISIMGPSNEQTNPAVDVSTSARNALGWRNATSGAGATAVVDVVRTATASITLFAPDPTSDTTPTYSATAGNTAFPPGGCNILGGACQRTPVAVNIARVGGAEWNVDGGGFTTSGVVPTDGAFDEEADPYTFTPPNPIAGGTHTFGTRSINTFGDTSSTAADVLTISTVSCSPRPAVQVTATASGSNSLIATVAATGGSQLSSIVFGAGTNALITAGGQVDQTGNFTVSLPTGPTTFQFTVRHATPGAATHVPFTVNDSCGSWPTFVGGGAGAF